VKQVVDLVEAIGAKPLFMDAIEHDSFTAAMTALPVVAAAAIMDAVSSSPSWREIARFAGRDFNAVTEPSASDPAISHGLAATNPEMAVYWIDELIARLRRMRDGISDEQARFDADGTLASTFVRAWEARARLEAGVVTEDRPNDNPIPTASEGMMSLFLGNRAAKFLSGKKEEKDPTKYDKRRLN
jgi:prephenate dehydrogenase